EEPDVREARNDEEGLGRPDVLARDREGDEREADVGVAERRKVDAHRAATLQHSQGVRRSCGTKRRRSASASCGSTGTASSGPSCRVHPRHVRGQTPDMSSRSGCGTSSPAVLTTSPTSTSTTTTASTAIASARCARCRAATSSPTASWRRSRAVPARRAQRARSARATASRRSSRAIASSRPTASAATAHWVWSTSDVCSRSKMSFSEDLRDELASIAPRRRCCRLAELSALFHTAGVWHLRGRGELAVHLDLGSGHAARRAFSLLRELGVESQIRTYPRHAFDKATRYQLHTAVDERVREVLQEAGVISDRGAPLERPPKRVVGRSCCRSAYLRGALLGGGSLSGPRSPHL